MAPSRDDEANETVRFQEAFGAGLFRQGKPRAVLEVKNPHIPTAVYEARLKGYDGAKERSAASKTKGHTQKGEG